MADKALKQTVGDGWSDFCEEAAARNRRFGHSYSKTRYRECNPILELRFWIADGKSLTLRVLQTILASANCEHDR